MKQMLLMSLMVLWVGCHKGPVFKKVTHLSAAQVLGQVNAQADERKNLNAQIHFRAYKMFGLFGEVEADAMLEYPNRLFLSMRSFFEQPAKAFASDGSNYYFLELAGRKPIYRTGFLSASILERTFQIAMSPTELVSLLLGLAPQLTASNVTNMSVDSHGCIYKIEGSLKTGKNVVYQWDTCERKMLQYEVKDDSGVVLTSVSYGSFRALTGLPFAHRWNVRLGNAKESIEFTLQALSVTLHRGRMPIRTFQIEEP